MKAETNTKHTPGAAVTAYTDGGRAASGHGKAKTGDCVSRAISIATGVPYDEVHAALAPANAAAFAKDAERYVRGLMRLSGLSKAQARKHPKVLLYLKRAADPDTSPDYGTDEKAYGPYLESLGWEWVPTMGIGTGCRVHLRADELPAGRIIARVSRHLCAVIDGVVHDTHDPSRGGTRCVYGYYRKAGPVAPPKKVAVACTEHSLRGCRLCAVETP